MSSSMWLIVASMLATVAGVVVNKVVESITGQQAKNALDKERARINAEYAQMRKQLQERIEELEAKLEAMQAENLRLIKETTKLELEYKICRQQFAWLHKCNPKLFESCPNLDLLESELEDDE